MKIAILTSSFPRYPGDFQGNFVFHQARGQVEHGDEVHVICPYIIGTQFHEIMDGITIHRFPYFYPYRLQCLYSETGMYSAIHHSFLAVFQLPFFFICQLNIVRNVLRSQKIDIIHSHWLIPQGLVGALLHSLTKIPHITTVHGTDANLLKRFTLLHRIGCFIIRNSEVITVNSRYMKQQLLTVSPECERKVRVIPMGINQVPFTAASFVDMKQHHRVGHIILSVGRLIDWKGTKFLIAAMPAVLVKYPDAKLFIIGTGPERDALIQCVRERGLGDRVEFFGTVPVADLRSYYRSADVFVLPSINYAGKTEGLGVVLLEAMAAGCPVIGSNVGGIPDIIIDGENGFLVPEQDPAAIAEKIVLIMSDAILREKFRKTGYTCIQESFSWSAITERFSAIYSYVIHNKLQSREI